MRSGGAFSDEEIQLLRGLPAVSNVTRDRITYSDTFRQVCTIRYLAGESPTKIFREAGLPPELVGYKRIERSVARWKEAAIKSVSGNDHLDDSEIIAQLVERYKRTLVTKRNLDNMASRVPDSSVPVMSEGAVGAHVSISALDGDTAGIIIKQQARRIDELERANASLLDKLNKAIPSPTVDDRKPFVCLIDMWIFRGRLPRDLHKMPPIWHAANMVCAICGRVPRKKRLEGMIYPL